MNRLIIEDITIVTMNPGREILENQSLVVVDDKITKIYPTKGRETVTHEKGGCEARIMNGSGKILFPI